MAHIDLASLKPNVFVEGVYSVLNPQMGATRSGKPYLKCLIRDATSEVPARHWSFEEAAFADLGTTGFVRIAGHSQLYNESVQIILEQIEAVTVTQEQMASLLPTTTKDVEEMFAEVQRILASLEHPAMKALARAYLDDTALMAEFRMAPAGMSLHHAWIGGLLEHTLQLLKLAEGMLPGYPALNRDLVLMGLFLHDLGKVTELTWERGFDYTADGNLIGHVVRGAIWLQFKAAVAARSSGTRLPSEALRALQHIILSHHGEPEHGAARTPSTPEAIFVAMLDNLDAKTSMALVACRDERGAGSAAEFTDRIWALGTRLYRPDPLAPPAPADTTKQAESAATPPAAAPKPPPAPKPQAPAPPPRPQSSAAPAPQPAPEAQPAPPPMQADPPAPQPQPSGAETPPPPSPPPPAPPATDQPAPAVTRASSDS